MEDSEVRALFLELLKPQLEAAGVNTDDLVDSSNLVELGVLDSFDFLKLSGDMQDKTGRTMDFTLVDVEDFTTVGGFLKTLR